MRETITASALLFSTCLRAETIENITGQIIVITRKKIIVVVDEPQTCTATGRRANVGTLCRTSNAAKVGPEVFFLGTSQTTNVQARTIDMIKATNNLQAETPRLYSTVERSILLTTEKANKPISGIRIIEKAAIKCLVSRFR